jgi:hypothetical protein
MYEVQRRGLGGRVETWTSQCSGSDWHYLSHKLLLYGTRKAEQKRFCRVKAMLAQTLLHVSEADKEEAMLPNRFSNFDLSSWLQE